MSVQSYLNQSYDIMVQKDLDDKGVLEHLKQLQDNFNTNGINEPEIFGERKYFIRVLLACVANKRIFDELETKPMADRQLSIFLSNSLLIRASYDNSLSPEYLRGMVNVILNNKPNQPVPMLAFAIGFVMGRSLLLGNDNAIYMADLCTESYIGSSKKSFLNGLEAGFSLNDNGLLHISNYVKKLDERYESWGQEHRRFCYRILQLAGKYPTFDIDYQQPRIQQAQKLSLDHERISWFLYGRYPSEFTKTLTLKYFQATKEQEQSMTVRREVVKEVEVIKEVIKEVEPSQVLLAAQELSKFATSAKNQFDEQTQLLEQELKELEALEAKPSIRKMV